MSFTELMQSLYQTYLERSANARVTLLHARSRYRTALLSYILLDEDRRVFYYALGSDDIDLLSFIAGVTHDLSEQFPAFGGNVNQAVARDPRDIDGILAAFVQDLNEHADRPYVVVLDEVDRAEVGDDLQIFIERLVDALPAEAHLVISSRSLPRLPWMALIAQKKAVLLRDSELVAQNFYTSQADESARISIQGFTPGNVLLDGKIVGEWEGHLPRLLFFFAMERPVVTRSEICAAFWPDLTTEQAVNVFHVTKRRLHKALEGVSADILVHEDGYYRVNPDIRVHYDVVDFVSTLVDGRLSGDDHRRQMAAWQKAIDLYQKPYLFGHNEDWIVKRRAEYQVGYLEALAGLARGRAVEGRPESALALLLKAIAEDNRRQDLHRDIMMLYADMGRRSEAASHYQRLQDELSRAKLQLEPETAELFSDLMS
ncbi:MAG: BTAD domain-containing putative transcriptional regulator [Anaerolineae bacterium]|nr:hypothetical protein [Anaerolineae bacterium]